MTVKVALPSAPVVPVTVVIVELPAPWASVTAFAGTGLPNTSCRVTVMVAVVEPSAAT